MRRAAVLFGLTACGRFGFGDLGPVDAAPSTPDGAVACPSDPDLLACYAFEGDAVDLTGRGNTAVVTNAAFAEGIDGQAIQLDATSRADIATVNLETADLTIEAWIFPTSYPSDVLVFDHNDHWSMALDPEGALRCQTVGTFPSSVEKVPLNTWTHVACVVEGTLATGYIGNTAVISTTVAAINPGNDAAAVGGDAPVDDVPTPFVGKIDRLRIWSTARAQP